MSYNHSPFFSKISVQGKNQDELSYVFSSGPIEQKKCSVYLFGVFAISSSQEIYQQFIKQTVKHFTDFYHRISSQKDRSADDESVDHAEFLFENAIQYVYDKVTSSLIEFQEQRKRSYPLDIKKIHCILGCLSDDTIYLSSTGNVLRSYYIYPSAQKQGLTRYSSAAIIDQQQNDEQSQRLFSHIISGAVGLPGSTVCITTLSVLDYLSLDQLKQLITTQQPESLSASLNKMLGKVSARNDMSALFIHPKHTGSSQGELNSYREQTASNKSMEELNSRQRGTDNVMSSARTIQLNALFSLIGSTFTNVFKLIAKLEKWLFQPATWTRIRSLLKRLIAALKYCLTKISHIIRSIVKRRASFDFKKAITIPNTNARATLETAQTALREKSLRILEPIRNTFVRLPIASRFLLVLSVLFMTLFIYSLFALSENRKNNQHRMAVDTIIQSLQQKYSEADARLIFQNDSNVLSSVNEMKQLIQNIPGPYSESQKTSIASLQTNIQALEQKLNHISVIANPTPIASLDGFPQESPVDFSEQGKGALLSSDTVLTFIDSQNSKTRTIPLPASIQSTRTATLLTPNTLIVSNTDGTRIFHIAADSTSKALSFPFGQSESQTDKLCVYNGNVYSYDSKAGAIFKHIKQSEGFSVGSNWIRDKSVDLHEILDMDIDGTIYILKNGNQLFQYINGKPKPLPLPLLQPPLQSLTKADADPLSPFLFLLEQQGNRIIILDKKTLELKAQFTSPVFGHLRDIQFSPRDKNLIVLDNSTLFRIPLSEMK